MSRPHGGSAADLESPKWIIARSTKRSINVGTAWPTRRVRLSSSLSWPPVSLAHISVPTRDILGPPDSVCGCIRSVDLYRWSARMIPACLLSLALLERVANHVASV